MAILFYQTLIVVTLLITRVVARRHFYTACLLWTAFTVVNLFWPPLIVLQLAVIWGTAALVGPKGEATE